ncbi:MAG: hypothetical protein QOF33_1369 [Thermomicrobiales bacterium]|nr:hypothetical protein [Thermomicrobiales bacterium]MEA2583284.1 hypothetical protein [Thermomicrobiales bacterium]MEA2594236.1 hypothetical protein [Thermomicrobiales bacterium]
MSHDERRTWEYRAVENPGTDELDALGREGWELASAFTAGEETRLLFKRPRPSFRDEVTLDQKRRYFAQWGLAAAEDDGRPDR